MTDRAETQIDWKAHATLWKQCAGRMYRTRAPKPAVDAPGDNPVCPRCGEITVGRACLSCAHDGRVPEAKPAEPAAELVTVEYQRGTMDAWVVRIGGHYVNDERRKEDAESEYAEPIRNAITAHTSALVKAAEERAYERAAQELINDWSNEDVMKFASFMVDRIRALAKDGGK